MAHLTKPERYDIKDSNIALLGSDLEKKVREHAGDKESAWAEAGLAPGTQIWRIEKFAVVSWPRDRIGSFYDGDSYLVLHTYKKTPDSDSLSYDLHFWLGENTSQDEAGTAAFKTVELDDHLHWLPVQYREVQGAESSRFLSYFPRFVCLRGGVSTGFHHVSSPPPLNLHRLYRITLTRQTGGRSHLQVREVPAESNSLVEGDAFVLDKGSMILQFNTKASAGQEKFKAAEFVQSLINERQGQSDVTVYGTSFHDSGATIFTHNHADEGGHGAGIFLSEFGVDAIPRDSPQEEKSESPLSLYRLSDSSGTVTFEAVDSPSFSSLSSSDAFLLDHSSSPLQPAIYVWIGQSASLTERRLAVQYAQNYVYKKQSEGGHFKVSISLVKMNEGQEPEAFKQAFAT